MRRQWWRAVEAAKRPVERVPAGRAVLAARRGHQVARRAASAQPPVSPLIAVDDAMFDHPKHYFAVGASAVSAVKECLSATGVGFPQAVLDFPCGHGRVLRYLAAAWPAHLTAGDIDRSAVDFCVEAFGASPLYSRDPIGDLDAGRLFDLVWSGSLLTHFDAGRWPDTLEFFRRHLAPGGIVIFTTHGDHCARSMERGKETYGFASADVVQLVAAYRSHGFAFAGYPTTGGAYGHSLSAPSWVHDQVARVGMRVGHFIEQGWDGHQDVYACTPIS